MAAMAPFFVSDTMAISWGCDGNTIYTVEVHALGGDFMALDGNLNQISPHWIHICGIL
jgi:hypothetical protein